MKAIPGIFLGLVLAFLFSARAAEPAPGPADLKNAHGRLEVDYVSVPQEKMGLFADCFDATGATPDLADILKKTDSKIVASATTSLCLGGDGAMLEVAHSRLTLRPRVVAPNQLHLDGLLSRPTFCGTFDVLIQPGVYQLFLEWNQPESRGEHEPYNALVARVREISVVDADGTVRYLPASPSLQTTPASEQIHAANR